MTVYIGLGTNLGDRGANLLRAKELVREAGIAITKESSILATEPVDVLDQPEFLNQIIVAETDLSAAALLAALKAVETKMGRVRVIDKGPRIIDLDILLYGSEVLDTPELVVPHYAIRTRAFILRHLVELEPALRDPRDGVPYADCLR